jgi:hypothetical protein
MLKVNHIKVGRSFKELHMLVVPLLVDHKSATLKVNHKQELVKDILMVTLILEEVDNSHQVLKTITN